MKFYYFSIRGYYDDLKSNKIETIHVYHLDPNEITHNTLSGYKYKNLMK